MSHHGPVSEPASQASAIRRVLVVDDSRAQLLTLSTILKNWGLETIEARSGEEALAHCNDHAIDLVISDWLMPGMSGLDLCRAFRNVRRDRYIYFILLTSRDSREDVALGLSAGADDFLSKPLDTNELRARIAAGDRLVSAQRELLEKNQLLGHALDELQQVYDALSRDLAEARVFQQSLVPQRFIKTDGAEISLLLRPSGHVGGDLVGAFPVSKTQMALFAIDVSGHGVASALLGARLAGLFNGRNPSQNIALAKAEDGAIELRELGEVCGDLNKILNEDIESELYATMTLVDCNMANGQVRIVQAGHPPATILRHDGRIESVESGNLPIGLIDGARYQREELQLRPGDRLIICSDGVTECSGPDGDMFERSRLVSFLSGARGVPGPDTLDGLVARLVDHAGSEDLDDDVSAVLLDFEGAASGDQAA